MSLQDTISQLIKEEIEKDPMGVGYAGKTDEEIQILLNSGVTKQVITYITNPPPISRILNGVGYAPNVCAVSDVTSAKLIITKPVLEVIK